MSQDNCTEDCSLKNIHLFRSTGSSRCASGDIGDDQCSDSKAMQKDNPCVLNTTIQSDHMSTPSNAASSGHKLDVCCSNDSLPPTDTRTSMLGLEANKDSSEAVSCCNVQIQSGQYNDKNDDNLELESDFDEAGKLLVYSDPVGQISDLDHQSKLSEILPDASLTIEARPDAIYRSGDGIIRTNVAQSLDKINEKKSYSQHVDSFHESIPTIDHRLIDCPPFTPINKSEKNRSGNFYDKDRSIYSYAPNEHQQHLKSSDEEYTYVQDGAEMIGRYNPHYHNSQNLSRQSYLLETSNQSGVDWNGEAIPMDESTNPTNPNASYGELLNQTNLIVNYLPPFMTQDEVKSLFSSIGDVESCKLVREKATGESLGYAFVKFIKPMDAEKAIKTLNGLRLQNKTIKVSLARPSSESIKGANLYICGLPKKMAQADLEGLFEQCGRIITARILYDNKTGLSRGVAFIRFDQRHEAELAIRLLNGYQAPSEHPNDPPNAPITVKFANSPNSVRHDSLSLTLLKQAAQLQSVAASVVAPPSRSAATAAAVAAAGLFNPLQQLASFSNRLKYSNGLSGSPCSPGPSPADFLPAMASAAAVVNPLLAPAVAASSGALTSTGWCVFVYNLAPETEEANVWQLFGPFGAVQTVKIIRDPTTNKCKGFGFITMSNYEEALLAIHSLNGFTFGNRILQVSFKTTPNAKLRPSSANTPPPTLSPLPSVGLQCANFSPNHSSLSTQHNIESGHVNMRRNTTPNIYSGTGNQQKWMEYAAETSPLDNIHSSSRRQGPRASSPQAGYSSNNSVLIPRYANECGASNGDDRFTLDNSIQKNIQPELSSSFSGSLAIKPSRFIVNSERNVHERIRNQNDRNCKTFKSRNVNVESNNSGRSNRLAHNFEMKT